MKNRPSSPYGAGRSHRRWLGIVLLSGLVACSDAESLVTAPPLPSSPAGPSTVGPQVAPAPNAEEPTTYGAPGADPVSAPVENDGPGATETNLLTPPCGEDSDCGDGRRCGGGARPTLASGADGGAAARDGGADAGDASAPDVGVVLGRCERIDGG